MGKETPLAGTDRKIRFMNEITMDEVWQLARPKFEQTRWPSNIPKSVKRDDAYLAIDGQDNSARPRKVRFTNG